MREFMMQFLCGVPHKPTHAITPMMHVSPTAVSPPVYHIT